MSPWQFVRSPRNFPGNSGTGNNGGQGLVINLVFDPATTGGGLVAPSFFSSAQMAASMLMAAAPQTPVTVNIGVRATAGATSSSAANGSVTLSYAATRALLAANVKSWGMQTLVNFLPGGTSIGPVNTINFADAQSKAYGLLPQSSSIDGNVVMGTGTPVGNLVGIFLHEISHAMGRVTGGAANIAVVTGLSCYDSAGVIDPQQLNQPNFFSLDGQHMICQYATTSDLSDLQNISSGGAGPWADSAVSPNLDPFDAFYFSNTLQFLTPIDILIMQSIGFQ